MRIGGLGGFGSRTTRVVPAIPEWLLKELFPEEAAREQKRRRTDRARVEAGRATLAKLPGTVEKVTRAEAASILGCSVRQVQRYEKSGKLDRCSQHGREVTYLTRDVRRLDSALRKGR